ncbi:MAG: hypothetical protein RL538_817 [Candidatus Parcubacteria bacterium]|jgi:hypothetical protein
MEAPLTKLALLVISMILIIIAYGPYVKDILAKRVQPHLYTWLIWSITVSIAAAGVLFGGGGVLGAIPVMVDAGLVMLVCGLSFKYGSKNIRRADTITFIAALAAIGAWLLLDQPLLAVLLATTIDALGYVPTYRKSIEEPCSETSLYWAAASGNVLLAIAALQEYSIMTTLYLTMSATANLGLFAILYYKRWRTPGLCLVPNDPLPPRQESGSL